MKPVLTIRNGDVEIWTLNRPDVRNALEPHLVSALAAAVDQAERTGVRSVILTGAGNSFCAGADLSYLYACAQEHRAPRPFLRSICDLTLAIEASPIIFIAALHGHAVAGGLELALSCDLVIAAAGTLIGDGHVRNNLVPGGGASVRLAPKLGRATAAWLALSGELVPAEALATTGWLHTIVPPEDLEATALTIARTLSERPAEAQSRYKNLLGDDPVLTNRRLEDELDVFDEHWATGDVAGYLTKFLTPAKKVDHV